MKIPGRAALLGIVAAAALSALAPSAQAAPSNDELLTTTAPAITTSSAQSQADYWAAAEPRARAVKAEYDIPASVTAAQAAHESAFGGSRLPLGRNFCWPKGIKPAQAAVWLCADKGYQFGE